MTGNDEVTLLLREICDAIRGTNEHLDGTNARIDKLTTTMTAGFDAINVRIEELTAEMKAGFDGLGHMLTELDVIAADVVVRSRSRRATTEGAARSRGAAW